MTARIVFLGVCKCEYGMMVFPRYRIAFEA